MNALRDLGYLVLFLVVVFGAFEVMGHCQESSISGMEIHQGTTPFYGIELPDNPEPQVEKVRFFTVGRWDRPKPLRTNREIVHSKTFWLEELALYGSAFAEMDIARGGRQNPPVPHGRDLWIDAFVPLPAITFFHVIGRKYLCQCIGDGAVLGATAWNLYAAGKQYYH